MSRSLPPRNRSLLRFAAELLGIALILGGFYAWQTRNLLPADLHTAPALRAPSLGGSSVDVGLIEADVILVYFFAPWCKVCAASSGNLESLRSLRSEDDLAVLLVALDWHTESEVDDYVKRHEITVPVLLGDRKIAHDWNIYAYPTYYILDDRKRVIRRDLGYSTLAGLWWRTSGD